MHKLTLLISLQVISKFRQVSRGSLPRWKFHKHVKPPDLMFSMTKLMQARVKVNLQLYLQ